MLEEIMGYIHNYFEYKKVKGSFVISSGVLDCDFLQEGQYFRIVGSVFNDGVWKYPQDTLYDEEFTGVVWLLAVPPAVENLAGEIEAWITANRDALVSPYQSESFGGYSYTKASSENSGLDSWKTVFGARLDRWRKLS